MNGALSLAMLTGFYPLAGAWAANRSTTLRSGLAWAGAAQGAFVIRALAPDSMLAVYIGLCLAACAGIAVLGARRPGVGAWNFVVVGLFAVLLLPVASGFGTPRLEQAHVIF